MIFCQNENLEEREFGGYLAEKDNLRLLVSYFFLLVFTFTREPHISREYLSRSIAC